MSGRPIIAAVLSAFVPGLGQLYARRPLRAAVFFLPTVAVGIAAYLFFDRGTFGMADLLVRPSFLTGLLILDALLLAWRAAAIIDAFVISAPVEDRGWLAVPLAFILLLIALPHAVAGSYVTQTIDALNTVFVAAPADEQIAILPSSDFTASTTTLPPEPETTRNFYERGEQPAGDRSGIGHPDAAFAWDNLNAAHVEPAPFAPPEDPLDTDRLTILLVGADAGPGREGLRTDSMNVASIDLKTGQVAIFGLPRNFKLVPLPSRFRNSFINLEKRVIEKDNTDADSDGYPDTWYDQDGDLIPDEPPFQSCHCFPTMLNKVHQYTEDWTTTYPYSPDPGLSALKEVISNMIDLPIDYFLMVEMAGFVRTIDAIGGVDILVKEPYHVTVSSPEEGQPKASVQVEPGMNRLDGLEALAYSRWRIGSSDYHRMRRQRCLVRAAATKTDTVTLIKAFPNLVSIMKDYVTTDVPIGALPDLVWAAGQIDLDNVATVGLVPPTYTSGRTPGKFPIPYVSRIQAKVRDVIENGVEAQSRSGESECA
jgi:LCP family protein required for cell wall assembly